LVVDKFLLLEQARDFGSLREHRRRRDDKCVGTGQEDDGVIRRRRIGSIDETRDEQSFVSTTCSCTIRSECNRRIALVDVRGGTAKVTTASRYSRKSKVSTKIDVVKQCTLLF